MARLRFDSNGNLEFEGTPQELLVIYNELKQQTSTKVPSKDFPQVISNSSKIPTVMLRAQFVPNDVEQLFERMPSVEQLTFYILGKTKFEHDIVEVEKRFFGKQINSRQYGKVYRELRTRLEAARKSIEASQRGAFERKPTPYRNLPAYVFKKVNATPIDTALPKTS
jgi:hypothetical protein